MNMQDYKPINSHKSVGQELEYLVLSSDEPKKFYDFPNFIVQGIKSKVPNIKLKTNHPWVYLDAFNIELCSSPHPNISLLLEEMQEIYDALDSIVKERGFKIEKNAFCKIPSKNGINIHSIAASHVHLGCKFSKRNALMNALIPYLPIFAALANNSPTEKKPQGSERLRQRNMSFEVEYDRSNKNDSAIYNHKKTQTIEVRCLDRGKSLEDDIAVAAYVFATSEKIKDKMKFFEKPEKILKKNFDRLYLENEEPRLTACGRRIASGILLQRASYDGLEAETRIKENYRNRTLRGLAKQHYYSIKDKLEELKMPKKLSENLEKKIFR